MASLVLARKWRPQTFDTVAGQTHVVQTLTHALNTQRLHHAYLFTGTRGVGKTSIARIFAKALSCEKGISANPCGACLNCQEIDSGRFVDMIEIDAASRSKVEDTREILDNVLYAPVRGRYKIYLIDEIHMLSGHSFNALLKTLEEPPEHVIFILATTDPKKLPITVLSRCLQFHLKNMLPNEITAHLSHILQKENIVYEAEALPWIAQAADGSLRDALSLLDQAIAHGYNEVKEKDVREMLGFIEIQYITRLVEALIARNHQELLNISADLQHQGADCAYILRELQNLFHQMTIVQCVPNYQNDSSFMAIAKVLAPQMSAEDLQLFYQIALKGSQDLALAPTPWVAFEMTLLRMLCFQIVDTVNVVPPDVPPHPSLPPRGGKALDRSTQVMQSTKPLPVSAPSVPAPVVPVPAEKIVAKQPNPILQSPQVSVGALPLWARVDRQPQGPAPTKIEVMQTPAQQIHANNINNPNTWNGSWDTLLPLLNLSGLAKNIAQHCTLEKLSEDFLANNTYTKITLNIPTQQKNLFSDGIKQQLESCLIEHFLKKHQKNITLAFNLAEEPLASPAVKKEEKKQEAIIKTKTSFDNDPNFHKILEKFHGTIVPDSIQFNEKI